MKPKSMWSCWWQWNRVRPGLSAVKSISALIAADHDDVFDDAGGGLASDLCELEAVAVEMDGVDVVAGVAHAHAVALALMEMEGWLGHHMVRGIGDAVDGPLIESVVVRHFVFRRACRKFRRDARMRGRG